MLLTIRGKSPDVGRAAFIAPDATLAGEVVMEPESSVWFGSVVRSEAGPIRIGENTVIEDLAVLHCPEDQYPLTIGKNVTVGHCAIVHGCTLEDNVLIGMGATVMNGAHIGEGSIVGAGALVTEGVQVPPRSLVLGVPGRVVRQVTDEMYASNIANAKHYVELSHEYREAAQAGTICQSNGSK